MNDPAPPFGRGGWVCIALLLGLFAGGGITWAIMSRRVVKSPLIVYQLPPSETVTADTSDPAKDGSHPGVVSGDPNTAQDGPTIPESTRDAVPEPRLLAPSAQDRETVEPAVLDQGNTSNYSAQSAMHIDSDRLLHNHPKARGCLANALATLAPFAEKGFILRDKVWEGEISLEEGKAVSCQLFKGNSYCFCIGTDAKGAKLSLQLYSSSGEPIDAEEPGQRVASGASAITCWHCSQTGTYFVVVKLEAATQEKAPWGMVSAYR